MKINKKHILLTLSLVSLISLSSAYGQTLDSAFAFESDNVNDVQAPIHMLVYLGLVIGGYLGVNQLRK